MKTQQLKELALKAGGDEWEYRKISGEHQVIRKGTLEKCQGYRTFQPVTNELDDIDIAKFIASASPSLVSRLIERLEAAERERDELRESLAVMDGRLSASRDLKQLWKHRAWDAEEEIARRDAAAGEPVAWEITTKPGEFSLTPDKSTAIRAINNGCCVRELYTAAPPAVLPAAIGEIRLGEYGDDGTRPATVVCIHDQAGWENFPDGTKLYLGAQPQKPVALPESVRINNGYYFNMDDIFAALDAANVPWR